MTTGKTIALTRWTFVGKVSLCFLRFFLKNVPANAGELQVPSVGWEDASSIRGLGYPLEEHMAIHSSILAQRIPWTEEPGWLQTMAMQEVRHD